MNTDAADTRYPHVDLDSLIAAAADQPVGDRARDHLASCAQCQRESSRWNLVADGIRGLAADAPETDQAARQSARESARQPASQLARQRGTRQRGTRQRGTRQRGTRQRGPAPTWRRALLVTTSAAAALVLLVGIGEVAGFVHVSFSGSGTQTVLTAVTGCSSLRQADGTLEHVTGNNLIVKTASGRVVTVTTTATTFLSRSGALLTDITDGASVMVRGSTSGGTIDAAIVTVGQPFSAVKPPRYVPVQGTVADASRAGFTLVTSSGTRIPVTTSSDTLVVIPHASPGQLQAGDTIFAIGQAEPNGTLSARAVASVSPLRSGTLDVGVHLRDCSPASVQEALGAISARSGTGG